MNLQYTKSSMRFLTRGWQVLWRSLAAVLLLFSMQQRADASHAMGADISYECLGNNQYRITLTYYRDCAGISAPTSASIAISSALCGVTLPNLTLAQDPTRSNIEVSQLCPQQLPQSRCNGGTLPGVQVFTYTGIVTLPQACRDWTVSYTECCRNSAITNLTTPDSRSIHVNAVINNTNGLCNNSPTFTSRPIPYICAGQPFSFSHGAIDSDGDSLIYVLISPLEGATAPIPHTVGLSPTNPMNTTPANTFGFSNNSGQMSFTPNGAQIAVVAVRVFEIRNGDTIGSVMRDIQVVVLNNCSNQNVQPAPVPIVDAGGSYDPASRSFFVCAGTQLIFRIGVRDPNGDSVLVDPRNTNLQQVFGAGNFGLFPIYPTGARDTMDLYVTINVPVPGYYSFIVGLRDNACPVPGSQTLGFNIAIPGIQVNARDTTICPGIAQQVPFISQLFTTGSISAPGRFTWTQIGGPAAPLSNDTIRNPILSVPGTTTAGQNISYAVQFTTNPDPVTGVQCITRDTVVVQLRNLPLNVDVRTQDTTLCQNGSNNTINLNTFVSGPGVDTVSGIYSWSTFPAGRISTLSSTTIPNPISTAGGTPGDSIRYRVQYNYGTCSGADSITVYFRRGRVQFNPTNPVICSGDTVQLIASLSDTFRIPTNQGCNDYTLSTIPYQTFPTTGTAGPTGDDVLSAALPIGFSFPFYCNTYTQFYISTNGFITFSPTAGSGCCTGQVLPNAAQPNDVIALAWEDLNPASRGNITYSTQGVAPNRRLIVSYNGVAFFGSPTNNVTGQIVLYEGSGTIEIYSGNIMNGGFDNVTQGLENSTGTVGHPVPGRNSAVWTATNSAVRFTRAPSFIALGTTQQWTPRTGLSNDTIARPRAFPVATTTYRVTITEGNCPMTDSVTVTVQSSLPAPVIACGTVADPSRTVGFQWGGVVGATAWEYSLDSGRTWILRPLQDSSFLATGLIPGACQTIYVRAVGGVGPCTRNAAAVFTCCTSPCNTTVTRISARNNFCFGDNSGEIVWLATGGSLGAPYRFTTYNATTGQVHAPLNRTNDTVRIFVPAGTYYVFVQDSFGCPGFSDTVTVTQPTLVLAALDTTTLTRCFNSADGSATVSGTGGTGAYTYQWSGAGAAQSTATATGLSVGTYSATVIDANGCFAVVNNIQVRAPFAQAPDVTVSVTNSTTCAGNGGIQVVAVQNMTGNPTPGAANALTYNWSTGASNTLQITGINSGIYYLTTTDVNGCSTIDTMLVMGTNVSITTPNLVNPDCGLTNGSARVNATGASSYTYLWNNGQTTQTATGLGGGTFTVTVTGNNGCTATASYVLNANTLAINIASIQERVCTGAATGFINVNTSSASTPSYVWSNGATTASLSGLAAGTYTLTATAQNGGVVCTATLSATIREPNPAFAVDAQVTNGLDCSGNAIGQGVAVTSGGWGSYQFIWSNGATTRDLNNLAAGTYTVTATDDIGCVFVDSLTILPVLAPQLNAWISTMGRVLDTVPVGTTVTIDAGFNQTAQGVSYQWVPNTNIANATAPATTVIAAAEGTFTYIVFATAGNCSVADTVTLVVEPIGLRGFPTAFTPDGDGNNDFFRPVQATANLNVSEFRIYNRWGQLVYNDPNNFLTGWDGTFNGQPQPRDVYMFVFVYTMPGQTTPIVLKGEVTLVR